MTQQADQPQHEARGRAMTRRMAAGASAALVAALAAMSVPAAGAAAASAAAGSAAVRPAAAAGGGTLRGWGLNRSGQLGDGTTTSSTVPVKAVLPAGIKITSVRAGCEHSIALTSDGEVLAWGNNNQGQLGDGTTTSSLTPVKVMLPAGTKVKAIRAGCEHNLVLTSSGQVLAWGDNASGELGDGTGVGRLTPVLLTLPKVKAISAGFQHSLAVTAAGRVLAWGDNREGQLGDGTATSSELPVRVKLPAGTKAVAVVAGVEHSLARTSKGKVLAWGNNINGELGNGTSGGRSDTPVRVRLPHGTKVRGLFAGCFHSLAVTSKGKVLAWGSNFNGQLGDGTTTDRDTPVRARLSSGTKATAVSAGCFHSLALTSKGHVLAWGNNSTGQLGIGTTSNSDLPARVKLPAGLVATSVSSGSDSLFSLAIVHKKP